MGTGRVRRAVDIRGVLRHAFKCCCASELSKRGRVKVEFTDVLKSALADAEYFPKEKFGLIRLSEKEWKLLNRDQRTELLTHEAVHLAAAVLYGSNPDVRDHGREFRDMMAACGYPDAKACIEV